METPLCSVCLESDMLCSGCNAKLQDGDITQMEVDVSRFLHTLSEDNQPLEEAHIKEMFDTANVLVIVTEPGDAAKVVGRRGNVVKKIVDYVGKPVRVVEDTAEDQECAENLLMPVPVKSVNVVYKPEGEEKKVVVDESNEHRVQISKTAFRTVMKELTGENFELSFE